ncbi:MAG: peptide ABC transporter substrate-binding protein [Galactobacter sp.]
MLKNRKALGALSIIAASALALTACGGDSDSGSKKSEAKGVGGDATVDANAKATTETISTNGTEPQMPLIPTNTTEVGGGKIIDLLFSGLTSFKADGEVQMDQAESMEANEDNTVWTVKLKEGAKFSDGTPVTADSYIKAWNYGANLKNAQGGSYFFENIKGYSAEKNVDELSGLKKVSDTEFTVSLINPEADFQLRVGYSAFVPLPESAFKDMKAFGESPVGNGSYKLATADAWTHNKGIKLVKNDSYDGPKVAQNGGIDITFYTKLDTAYADAQSGNLDVLDQIPNAAFQTYEQDFGDQRTNQASALFRSFTIPQYLDHFGNDEEGKLRRQALSYAIDRDTITEKIFYGTRTPAKDFSSPVLSGWDEWGAKLEGNEVLSYDPEKAKDLWAKADKISKYDDTFTIAYNADADHKPWVTAVSEGLKDTLGIKAEGKAYPAFKQLLDDETNDKMTGAFRSGWQADYPGVDNFLSPLYQTGAGSNYGRYSSDEFDNLLKEGSAAKDSDEATKKYTEAQQVLLKDLPAIPLWYQNVEAVWGKDLKNVQVGWNSVRVYYQITK